MIDGRVLGPRTAAAIRRTSVGRRRRRTDVADMYRRLIEVRRRARVGSAFASHAKPVPACSSGLGGGTRSGGSPRFVSPGRAGEERRPTGKLLRSGFQAAREPSNSNTLADDRGALTSLRGAPPSKPRSGLSSPRRRRTIRRTEALKAELRTWRDDHRAFAGGGGTRSGAEEAPSRSPADISAQAAAGLEAMDVIIGRAHPPTARMERAQQDELLRRDDGLGRGPSASVSGRHDQPRSRRPIW